MQSLFCNKEQTKKLSKSETEGWSFYIETSAVVNPVTEMTFSEIVDTFQGLPCGLFLGLRL